MVVPSWAAAWEISPGRTDRESPGHFIHDLSRGSAVVHHDHVDLQPHQLRREIRNTAHVVAGVPDLYPEVLPLEPAEFAQTLPEAWSEPRRQGRIHREDPENPARLRFGRARRGEQAKGAEEGAAVHHRFPSFWSFRTSVAAIFAALMPVRAIR